MMAPGRKPPLVDRSIDVQTAIVDLRSTVAPFYEAALASGRWDVMAEAKAVADYLNLARLAARRVAGFSETECPADHGFGFGHGAGRHAA